MPNIRLLLATNNITVTQKLQKSLQMHPEISLIGHATQSNDIISLCAKNTPHVILFESIDDASLALIKDLRAIHPSCNIITIAHQVDVNHARKHLNAGVTGYLLEDDIFSGLTDSIWTAHQGKSVISTEITRALI